MQLIEDVDGHLAATRLPLQDQLLERLGGQPFIHKALGDGIAHDLHAAVLLERVSEEDVRGVGDRESVPTCCEPTARLLKETSVANDIIAEDRVRNKIKH